MLFWHIYGVVFQGTVLNVPGGFESTRRRVRRPPTYVLGAMSGLAPIITALPGTDRRCAEYRQPLIQRRINLVAESDATSASAWHLTLDHHQPPAQRISLIITFLTSAGRPSRPPPNHQLHPSVRPSVGAFPIFRKTDDETRRIFLHRTTPNRITDARND